MTLQLSFTRGLLSSLEILLSADFWIYTFVLMCIISIIKSFFSKKVISGDNSSTVTYKSKLSPLTLRIITLVASGILITAKRLIFFDPSMDMVVFIYDTVIQFIVVTAMYLIMGEFLFRMLRNAIGRQAALALGLEYKSPEKIKDEALSHKRKD